MKYFKSNFNVDGAPCVIQVTEGLTKFRWKKRNHFKITNSWINLTEYDKKTIKEYWAEITKKETFVEML